MQELENNNYNNEIKYINFFELLKLLIDGKKIIISVTSLAAIISVIYSINLPNIYESRALLAPSTTSENMANSINSFSGLSGLTGLDLPSFTSDSKQKKAIKKLSSLSFFENNFYKHIHLPDLMALNKWDKDSNTLIYNKERYNEDKDKWIEAPSVQESFEVFQKHTVIQEDRKSGFVTVAIKHKSPYVAKKWTELIVDQINFFYSQNEKEKSLKSLSYLEQELRMTNLSEIKQIIANLMQREIEKLALIEVNKFYVFEYLDPPAIMEKKSEPTRSIICIIGTIFGFILSIIIVILRSFNIKEKI